MIDPKVDIQENDILELSPELLNTLLKDHTLSTEDKQVNIFWATDNYADKGVGFQYKDQITIESITGENGDIIVPRALKSRATQQQRSREIVADLFGETGHISHCEGYKTGDIRKHNGIYALIKDWSAPKAMQKIRFIDLMK